MSEVFPILEQEGISIAFVYLGKYPPKYVWLNLVRTRDLFPMHKTVFITDNKLALRKARRLRITAFEYQGSERMPSVTHDPKFRSGFWHLSLERMFALAEWHESTGAGGVMHVEADVLLLGNFPFARLSKMSKLAWTQVNATHDCAALLYSASSVQTNWLKNEIRLALEENPSHTDMTALSCIANANRDEVETLPTWQNEWGVRESEDNRISCSTEIENGIFDAATIGMWLTGRDPRNDWGWTRLHVPTPEHYVKPEELSFRLTEGGLIASRDGHSANVFNLHVHSKSTHLFRTRSNDELARLVSRSEEPSIVSVFSWGAFTLASLDFTHTLFREALKGKNYVLLMKRLFH